MRKHGSTRFKLLAQAVAWAVALQWTASDLYARPVCQGTEPDPPFDASAATDDVRSELALQYAYWDRIDGHAAFDAAAAALRVAPDRLAFAQRLETLLLLFGDSHLHVAPTPAPSAAWIPSAADLWFEARGERLLVRDIKGGSAAARQGVRPGWELVTIDDADPRAVVDARFAASGIAADAAQRLYAINALAAGRLDHARRFTFRVDDRLRELELPPGYESTKPQAGLLHVTTLKDARGRPLVVVRVANSLGDYGLIDAFDRVVAAVPPDAHLVIDLRDTPSGGNSTVARALMGHFVTRPMPYQRHELTAERVRWGVARRWLEYVEPRAPYRGNRLFVLAGLWTGSMGEGLAIGLNAVAGATVIGSRMGQLLGATVTNEFATSCLKLIYANEKLWHVNGTPREKFLPGVLLPSADTDRDGGDPSLKRVLGLASQIGRR